MGQRGEGKIWLTPSFRCYLFKFRFHGQLIFSLHRRPCPPVEWSPCRPRTIQLPLTASPCSRLSRPQSTISQSDFHPIISPFSPHRLGRSYKLALEPDGSPLFPLTPLVACWRYEPREHPRPLALARPAIPPSPLSDRVGYSDHVRFRGYLPVHWCSGLQPPCLRFAAAVTGRHARLGTRLLAKLCRRRHLRRLSSTRLQGATLIGRVEDWRAGLGRSLVPLLARPFVCECPSISAVPRFQPPPRRTQRADFPHCAPPFASPQGLWDLSCWGSFQPVASHSIAVEQP